ncbi:restriction endonuclease subunit S [Psychrilyobacter atlanticus]|uniref:restriction endonuclease subunit S n=1 Tax=Psychrilyobacter atlanticus TaxID=271091 RepID=UPI0004266279|nr:restriction endonuclease subunit S [Psychrilyobacter atlanticus]
MENKLQPKLRFKEFNGDWESKNLSEVCSKLNVGFVGTCEKFYTTSSKGVKLIRTGNLVNGKVVTKNIKYVTNEFHEKNKKSQILNGDILIARHGSNGQASLYTDIDSANTLNIVILRAKEFMNNILLINLINSDRVKKQTLAVTAGSTQGVINTKEIAKLKIVYPTIFEQKKIASFLSSVDNKIGKLEEKKELLEEYKKGIMQKIFSQEIKFKNENGNEYPAWEFLKAKEIFKNQSNKEHNGDLPILAVTQDKGVVLRDNLNLKINSSEAGIKNYKIIEPGDFVISLRSFQGGIEYSNILGISSPAYTVLKPKLSISDVFYKNYLKKEDFISRLNSAVVGIRDGKQISYSVFGDLKLFYPCLEEQNRIANFLSMIDKKIGVVNTKINEMKDFKKGLLQQMFV